MKTKMLIVIFGTLCLIGVGIFNLLILDAAQLNKIYEGSVNNREAGKLLDFLTYTVDLQFQEKLKKRLIFSRSEKEWSEFALSTVSSVIEEKFKQKLKFSHFGQPYSYSTRPLNVRILFIIEQNSLNPEGISIVTKIERSQFYSSKIYESHFDQNTNLFGEMVKQGFSGEIHLWKKPDALPEYPENENELVEFIHAYAELIALSMNPNSTISSIAEEKLLNSRK